MKMITHPQIRWYGPLATDSARVTTLLRPMTAASTKSSKTVNSTRTSVRTIPRLSEATSEGKICVVNPIVSAVMPSDKTIRIVNPTFHGWSRLKIHRA